MVNDVFVILVSFSYLSAFCLPRLAIHSVRLFSSPSNQIHLLLCDHSLPSQAIFLTDQSQIPISQALSIEHEIS
jgi:hypothetical protein